VLFTLVYAGKYGTIQKLNTTQKKQTTQNTAKKATLVQSLLMTLSQETRWAYCTMFIRTSARSLHQVKMSVFGLTSMKTSSSCFDTVLACDTQTDRHHMIPYAKHRRLIDWLSMVLSAPTQYRLYVAEIKLNELYFAFKETLLPTNSSPIQSHHILWNLNH